MSDNDDNLILKSPNQLLDEAVEAMEIGHRPETEHEWMLVMNCWAANLPRDLVEVECDLLNKIFGSPLSDMTVVEIVQFHLRDRDEKGEPNRS